MNNETVKAVLLLKNIQVENANAISGLTYGFPAITHFLGFTHAMSRKLNAQYPMFRLGGCAVVSHKQQIHAHRRKKDDRNVFSLTRNPLTKEEKPAPFIEEGRMHLTISLLIECLFDSDDLPIAKCDFEKQFQNQVFVSRLAGGIITGIEKIMLEDVPEDFEAERQFTRRIIYQLLPGFLLVERSRLLAEHFKFLQKSRPEVEMMDAWLDFIALQSQSDPLPAEDSNHEVTWRILPKPGKGWLVPIMAGYRGISELYPPGAVRNARAPLIPACFVEAVYTIGQWISPHRVQRLAEIFWRYQTPPEQNWYLCKNEYENYNSLTKENNND